jgi:hypothetical protein
MAVMMGNLYDALVKAGAGEETARKAAEEMAGYDNCFSKLEADVGLLKWTVGFNLAVTVAILGKLLVGSH